MGSTTDNIVSLPDVGSSIRMSETEASAAISTYLSNVKVSNKAPEAGPMYLDNFFSVIQDILVARQNTENVKIDQRLLVVAEDPPEEIDTETITFFLEARAPGGYGRMTAHDNARVREVSPHVRFIEKHPEHPSERRVTFGRVYDNWIRFNIYARTDKVALERVIWFEQAIDAYDWWLRRNGYRLIELGVGDRERVTIGELRLTRYPMSYKVRTDDTFVMTEQQLRRVAVDVKASIS